MAYEICRNNGFSHIPLPDELARIPKLWFKDIMTAARAVRRQKQYNEASKAPPSDEG